MSEGALLPVAPAVAAAVADATGVMIRDLPLSPERVWRALREASSREANVPARRQAFELPRDDVLALVGGKAANLREMIGLGLPVPPGFVVTTETCRAFLGGGLAEGLDEELRTRMAEVEAAVGRGFGDAVGSLARQRPVGGAGVDARDDGHDPGPRSERRDRGRAGPRVRRCEAFARSCRERFEASFRSIVGVTDVPDDPWLQLRLAVEAVFRSWNSDRARAYRRTEGIADDLGTAVTVQAMVFGNRGPTSATGVLFTRNPATGEPTLYGDVMFDAQGEDVVAGTHATEPIAVLDARMPAVAAELREHASRLEHHYADLCDIEFTIEDGRLWMLQVRVGKRSPQAALRIAVDMAEDETFPLTRAEAVERVAALLAHPPTADRRADPDRGRARDRTAGLAGDGHGAIATSPEAALAAAEAGDRPSSSEPRRRPTTSTGWPGRPGS